MANWWLINLVNEVAYNESLWDSTKLGCSPAELERNPEEQRSYCFADHEGCPELRLWEDGFSVL